MTEMGTRITETDDTAILRDVTITTENKIEVIGDMIETDEMETNLANTLGGRIGRKTMKGTLVDTNAIVKGAEIARETIGEIGIGTVIMLKRKAGTGIETMIM